MIEDREKLIVEFLKNKGLEKAQRHPLSSDASFRRYERITGDNKSMMLMDAPPDKEDINPFINIDNYLLRRGLSSPKIYESDAINGLMLLEDFGDDSYSNVLSGKSEYSGKYKERELYLAAIDVLIQLDRSTLPAKMPEYDGQLLMKECRLLTDWYLPNINVDIDVDKAVDEYVDIWSKLLNFNKVSEDVLVLRDYHADNLMWLPSRNGVQNVGLLDFQDAVIGSPVYDIVSLLEDARRDVSKDTVNACIEHYLNVRKSINPDTFKAVYAILAAQRNCKIIGIFARLALRDGKVRYLDYLPRVWGHLESGLDHEVLKDLKAWFATYISKKSRDSKTFNLPSQEAAIG